MKLGIAMAGAAAAMLAAAEAPAAQYHGQTVSALDERPAPVSLTLSLPSRDPAGLDAYLNALQDRGSADYHHWLSPAAFARRFGANPADLAAAAGILGAAGFAVETQPRGLRLTGPATLARDYFAVPIGRIEDRQGHQRLAVLDEPTLPAGLARLGGRLIGLDPFIRLRSQVRQAAAPANRDSAEGSYWFDDLKQAYDAPSIKALAGSGRRIAILIDGDILDSDTKAFFGHEKLGAPRVVRKPVGRGAGFDPNGDSIEASLDVQQSAGIAPHATILLYLIENLSDDSILAGLRQVVADNEADVVSMSFGGCERSYSADYNDGHAETATLDEYESVFEQGNAQGITFVASSGDNGALGCPPPVYFDSPAGKTYSYHLGPEFPATSPRVTAVGGTNLVTASDPPSLDSAYVSENAQGDPLSPEDPFDTGNTLKGGYWGSGGGYSFYFAKPSFQKLFATGSTMRTVPDLSLHMGGCPSDAASCGSPRSSDLTEVNGSLRSLIGTSAAAPDFAGVVALWDQQVKDRQGDINPTIYRLAAAQHAKTAHGIFRQGIDGFNGHYRSSASGSAFYNMVVGNGSVDIRGLIGATAKPAAGLPQSPSNP